jgi:energy-coupling factor transporter ATP-binding protein EcfA2
MSFYNKTLSFAMQILAGLLIPTSGTVYVNEPKSFVFQNPDHQVFFSEVISVLLDSLLSFF